MGAATRAADGQKLLTGSGEAWPRSHRDHDRLRRPCQEFWTHATRGNDAISAGAARVRRRRLPGRRRYLLGVRGAHPARRCGQRGTVGPLPGRGHFRGFRTGRGHTHILSPAWAWHLGYRMRRAAEPDDDFDELDDADDGGGSPDLAFSWCPSFRRGFHVQRDRRGLVACRCGRDLVEVDERGWPALTISALPTNSPTANDSERQHRRTRRRQSPTARRSGRSSPEPPRRSPRHRTRGPNRLEGAGDRQTPQAPKPL